MKSKPQGNPIRVITVPPLHLHACQLDYTAAVWVLIHPGLRYSPWCGKIIKISKRCRTTFSLNGEAQQPWIRTPIVYLKLPTHFIKDTLTVCNTKQSPKQVLLVFVYDTGPEGTRSMLYWKQSHSLQAVPGVGFIGTTLINSLFANILRQRCQ